MTDLIERDGDRLRVRIDGDRVVGRALDCSGRIDPEAARAGLPESWLVASDPPPLAESLARAARSRGLSAPQADRIAELESQLESSEDPDPPDLTTARRRVAEREAEIDRLRERVATLRGRLAARREAGLDTASVEERLHETTRELTEVETEHHAARETLERARRRARRVRDDRERRLRLRDELRNRRRDARAWLAARIAPAFLTALARLDGREVESRDGRVADRPGEPATETGGERTTEIRDDPDSRDRADERAADGSGEPRDVLARLRSRVPDPVTGRLGAIAVAADDPAVVLAVDRDPNRLADRLDRPVLKV